LEDAENLIPWRDIIARHSVMVSTSAC